MDSHIPSPPSFLFYFSFSLTICWCLLLSCCCRFRVSCMESKVSWKNLHDQGNDLSLSFFSFPPSSFAFLLLYWFATVYYSFNCCTLKVPCMEAIVSWKNIHDKGNGFSLPFSSFLSLLICFSFIDLLMFIVVLLFHI